MLMKRRFVAAVSLGVVFSAAAFGQAMVEYGHGVARAGAAGAASGTGIAGIFSKVKESSEEEKGKHKGQPATASTQQPADAANAKDPNAPPNAPTKMTTSSGVVVSGISPSWIAEAYGDPLRQPVRVRSVEWTNKAEQQSQAEQGSEAAEPGPGSKAAPASSGGARSASHAPGEIVSPGHIVKGLSEQITAKPAPAPELTGPQFEPVTDAEVAGVKLGSSIDEAMHVLGKPAFSLTGITGKNYTAKYVFKNAAGETITVLTWNGAITSVSVS